jgi:hypothetical protein
MQRPSPRIALIPGLFGFMALFSNLGKDRVAALHGADIVGLLAAGFCFGVTFTVLITWYMTRKERSVGQ